MPESHKFRPKSDGSLGRASFVLAFIATLTLFSSGAGANIGIPLSGYDKIIHALVFGLMATQVCRIELLPDGAPRFGRLLFATIVVSLFGAADELNQFTNPLRYFEFGDWFADIFGAFLASALYLYWPAYRKILTSSILPLAQKSGKTKVSK